jgi:predicted nucleic acid-binding protein
VTQPVVADTTVWSNFALVDRPDLVAVAFPTVVSPPAVLDEIDAGRRQGLFENLPTTSVSGVELSQDERRRCVRLLRRLVPGEAECLVLAGSRRALLLTDDRAARRLARSMEIGVSGTLGVLARLVDLDHLTLDEADGLLARMLRAGYRSPVSTLRELL